MKKIKLLLNVVFCLMFTGSLIAQTFVSTEPSNRNVVLEEYTGVNCENCPLGHKVAVKLVADNPGRVVPVNIHRGTYANSTPDYKTLWGDALANQAGVNSYPSGTVNRHVFIGSNAVLARTDWPTYAAQILKQPSCVNVAAQSTIDWSTRKLTVTVEAYYTENSNTPTNMLNVAILQDNILGQQLGGFLYYPEMLIRDLYRHNHMLRDLITGQWGDTIPETTKGSFFTKTYTYNIPSDYKKVPMDMADLNIVVFVAEAKNEIITGSISSITHEYMNEADMLIEDLYFSRDVHTCDNDVQVEMIVRNISQHNIESYTVQYETGGVENSNSTYNITGRNIAAGMVDTLSLPLTRIIANKSNNFTATVIKANDMDLSLGNKQKIVILKDTAMTAANSLTIKIWQDRYGDNTTWKLFNSGGQVVDSGGPYEDLGASRTQLQTKETPSLTPDCYYFQIYDSYGDGINDGIGAGKYEIRAGDRLLHSSNGKFGFVETKYIKVEEGTGVNIVEDITENWQIYPNPVNDKMTISFTLNNAGNIAVSVCDILGKEVITKDKVLYAEGNHTVEINTQQLRAGGYIVKLQTCDGVVCKKILVRK